MSMLDTKQTWNDVLERSLHDHLILLDIDGVLMADGEDTIHSEVKEHALFLKVDNDVHIVSNTFRKSRCRYLSEVLAVPWVDSPYKKPSTRIMQYVENTQEKSILVIGDKFLTDRIFAWRIGAQCILLKRRVSKKDRWFIHLTYSIDDIALYTVRMFSKLF